jgi:hypothetical protein
MRGRDPFSLFLSFLVRASSSNSSAACASSSCVLLPAPFLHCPTCPARRLLSTRVEVAPPLHHRPPPGQGWQLPPRPSLWSPPTLVLPTPPTLTQHRTSVLIRCPERRWCPTTMRHHLYGPGSITTSLLRPPPSPLHCRPLSSVSPNLSSHRCRAPTIQ